MGLKCGEQHLIHVGDVARAHGEDHVAVVGAHGHHLGGQAHILNRLNPRACGSILESRSRVHDGGGADVREIGLLFTGREDAGDNDVIGFG